MMAPQTVELLPMPLQLKGNEAVIAHVAKNHLEALAPTRLRQLQIGIAVSAGLRDPDWVRVGDLAQMACDLVDRLCANGLVRRPMASLLDVLRLASGSDSLALTLLNAQLSLIALTQVSDGEVRFLEWQSGLPENFMAQANELAQRTESPA